MAWAAAHELELARRAAAMRGVGAAAGQITSIKTGDLSIGFASTQQGAGDADDDDYWRSTLYGQRYLSLRKSRAAGTPTRIL